MIALPAAPASRWPRLGAANSVVPLTRVEVATYHAVSGSGRGAMEELAGETVALLSSKRAKGRAFGKQIAFNVIPQVDTLGDDGVSRESGVCGREPAGCSVLPRCRSTPPRCACRSFRP